MRIVVIGGGLSGLAAAALAARSGHQVKLFEKANAPGGRAATQEIDGFSLNLGAHALYPSGPAVRTFAELGVSYSGGKPAPGGFAIDRGVLRTMPVGFVSMLSTSLLSLGAKVELAKLLAAASKIRSTARDDESVTTWIERMVATPEARGFLRGLMRLTTYSADLDRYSAGVAAGLLQRVIPENVLYLDGGWRTLVDGLRAAAVAAGVDVVTGERVVAVESDGGSVSRVRLASGPSCPAQAVIVAASPAAASALFPESETLARAVREAIQSTAATLDLALSSLPRPKHRFAIGMDRPLYFSVHSFAGRLAPAGGAVVHAAVYRSEGDDGDTMEAELEAMVDSLQPGWRDQVVERRFLPKLVVSNAIPRADRGGYAGRPSVRVPEVQGAFVAGDWLGSEGCLADAAIQSAREASAEAVRFVAARPSRSPALAALG